MVGRSKTEKQEKLTTKRVTTISMRAYKFMSDVFRLFVPGFVVRKIGGQNGEQVKENEVIMFT